MLQVASQCLNSFIYSFIHPFILQTLSEWYSTLHQVTRLPLIPGSAKYFSEVFSVETYFQNSKCYLTILLANWHTPRTNACKLRSLALFFSFLSARFLCKLYNHLCSYWENEELSLISFSPLLTSQLRPSRFSRPVLSVPFCLALDLVVCRPSGIKNLIFLPEGILLSFSWIACLSIYLRYQLRICQKKIVSRQF